MARKLTSNLIIHLVILCAVIFVISAPAQAITINDAGEKKLKETLSSYLQEQKDVVKAKGGELKTDGGIIIEQGEKYYAATLPAMTLNHDSGINIKFGLTAINAVPTDKNDNWKMSMAIPTPIIIVGEDDENIGQINIKDQNMSGIWSSSLGGFSKLSAKYNDISFALTNEVKGNVDFNIDGLSINSDLEETEKNLWDGPSSIKFSNITLNDQKQNIDFKIGSVAAQVNIKNYNNNAYKKAYLEIANSDTTSGFSNNILNLIKSSGESIAQISFNDIKVQNTSSDKPSVTSIDKISVGGESSFTKDKLNQTLSMSYDGLKSSANTPSLVPTQFKTAITLDKLPIEILLKLGEQVIAKNAETDTKTAPQAIAQQMMGDAVKKLQEAGTSLMLKNTNLGNSDYNVNLDGILKADSTSPLGGAGALTIETTNLDHIMAELQKTPQGSSMAQQLTMFRIISEEKANKNTAKILLSPQGNISINGKDMSALMGGGNNSAPAQ